MSMASVCCFLLGLALGGVASLPGAFLWPCRWPCAAGLFCAGVSVHQMRFPAGSLPPQLRFLPPVVPAVS